MKKALKIVDFEKSRNRSVTALYSESLSYSRIFAKSEELDDNLETAETKLDFMENTIE